MSTYALLFFNFAFQQQMQSSNTIGKQIFLIYLYFWVNAVFGSHMCGIRPFNMIIKE